MAFQAKFFFDFQGKLTKIIIEIYERLGTPKIREIFLKKVQKNAKIAKKPPKIHEKT